MDARDFLDQLGAAEIDHPGGTLLAHLGRVRDLLGEWSARPALRLAGLCHAAYGTDGFPKSLLPVSDRARLAAVIGAEAEALVYRYASCDRPRFADGWFVDRFTGAPVTLTHAELRDFAELTAANELDIVRVSREFRLRYGAGIRALLERLDPLLSEAARRAGRQELSVRAQLLPDLAMARENRPNPYPDGPRSTAPTAGARMWAPVYENGLLAGYAAGTVASVDTVDRLATVVYDDVHRCLEGTEVRGVLAYPVSLTPLPEAPGTP